MSLTQLYIQGMLSFAFHFYPYDKNALQPPKSVDMDGCIEIVQSQQTSWVLVCWKMIGFTAEYGSTSHHVL